jgi:predicted alpha-1,2-mannosidase
MLIDYVNPFVGTGGHGHTFPGATMPFGMVQLSPDTRLEGWDGCSGYHYSDSIVYGFSHTHLSGTGVADYCDILLMPVSGKVNLDNGYKEGVDFGYASRFTKKTEKAAPGFYSVHLDDYNIDVELTVSDRVGFHKYIYNDTEKRQAVIIDLNHRDVVLEAAMEKTATNEISGYRISNSWAKEQHVYFVAQFSSDIDDIILHTDNRVAGVFFKATENKEIKVRLGISPTSVVSARKNLNSEIKDWDFNAIQSKAELSWQNQLSKIKVSGGTLEQQKVFYTALYHTMVAPNLYSDVDGSYRSMDLSVKKDSTQEVYTVFSLWDTFRALHPLFNLIERKRTGSFIETFMKHFNEGGRLPVWELAANETECMIGYHSVPVIYDAYAKDIQYIQPEKSLEAMVSSAEHDHFGLGAYKNHGYIPSDKFSESVSRTLEYSYDDWCIAQMAKAGGYNDLYDKYLKRSLSYRNIFDSTTGFIRAKSNGSWVDGFDPTEVNFNFTEANAWQYSLFAPHDINGLIDLYGGDDNFENHLDQLFTSSSETSGRHQADITGLIGQYAHGNEPSHHMAYLYNFIGKPWKTQERVREILNTLYTSNPDGLSGNEDCGQMSAWYVLSALGFYAVTPGLDYYVIGSPIFDKAEIQLENGKSFTIETKNNSEKNIYIQSTTLNGKVYQNSFINYKDIIRGGHIIFEMGAKPNPNYGSKKENRPIAKVEVDNYIVIPWIEASAKSFLDSSEVKIKSDCSSCNIFYSINNQAYNPYSQPIILKNDAIIKCFVSDQEGNKSRVVESNFIKRDGDRSIELSSQYANQYSAGGDDALIDYIGGGSDFRTGSWQGYQGQDLEFIVDLKKTQNIKSISLGLLQDIGSWIWYPKNVSFSVSKEGNEFNSIQTVKNTFPDNEYGSYTQELGIKGNFKARFIKIKAESYGDCPAWHLGAGGKSWIFADEIRVH